METNQNPFNFEKIKDAKTESETQGTSKEADKILNPDTKRDESQKGHIHKIKLFIFYTMTFFAVTLAFITIWHMSMPSNTRWLTAEESTNLKGFFFTGIGAGILGKFGNKLTPS